MKTRPQDEAARPAPLSADSGGSVSAAASEGGSGGASPSAAFSSAAAPGGAAGGAGSGAADKPAVGDAPRTQPIAPPPAPPPQPTQTSVPSAKIEAVRPPSLSLPKGGGAIRPLGDTFKTNPSTGTGSYAIPIPAPTARGFGPSLALSYDSGSGNGPFGLGWSLSLGGVTRRTDRQLPLYEDANDSDIFVLAGAEDLVPEHPLPVDNPAEPTRMIRYRPRTEGGFARIEKHTEKATGESHWVVRSGDGSTRYYGRTAASRIFDPKDARRVFSWLLDRAEDDRGNVLEVEYAAENLDGVSRHNCAESHRTMAHRGVDITAGRYPKRIRYGSPTMHPTTLFPEAPAETDACFEVVFDYGEHDPNAPEPEPTPGMKWAVRQDPFSTYRAGFEVRTYRLCKRILMFHRFAELGTTPCLVSSIDFVYSESPSVTLLSSATHRGYLREPDGSYTSEAMPPLEFGYSLPTRAPKSLAFDEATLSGVDVQSVGRTTQWVDLDGEGLSGLLSREAGRFLYRRNLSGGKLAKAVPIATEPSIAPEQARIVDLEGNGIPTFVKLDGALPGSFAREAGELGNFRPFRQLPNGVSWSSARVNLLDLNGDGRDDLLVVTHSHYVWYPSLGAEGFGDPQMRPIAHSDDAGPSLWPSAPPHMGVFFADMTGDGQADLVRVLPGQVAYWPNLGHGRFGAMVVMQGPLRDIPRYAFDPRRIRMVDVDGTGTADLVYFDDRAYVFWNQAGNSFAPEPTVIHAVTGEAAKTVAVVDAFGRGTAQFVWARAPWQSGGPSLMAVDVVGETKPYLLTSVSNGLGLQTTVEYAPSTKFYLADNASGTPWAHPLPFPVHVVEKVVVYDAVRRHRFVQQYSYHHGGYDPDEREFRGFGRVDTLDTEWTDATVGKGLFANLPPAVNNERPQPPVLTKTWFHLGIVRHARKFAEAYSREQWRPAGAAGPSLLQGPAVLEELSASGSPSDAQWHEAMRAMRGQTLRVEVHGLDGADNDGVPVQVAETRVRVVQKQAPRGGKGATAKHGVMFVHGEEAVTVHYEKNELDPRVAHTLTLEVDDYGVATREATVVYGRKVPTPYPEQQSTHVVVGTRQVLHFAGTGGSGGAGGGGPSKEPYRLAVPLAEQAYELMTPSAPAGAASLYTHAEILTAFNGATEVPYETVAGAGDKRLLGSAIHRYYDSANLPTPLAEGAADARALPYESYALAFTPGLISSVYGSKVDATLLTTAGYEDRGLDGFWSKSGRQLFDASHFYVPTAVLDPFGRTTTITYDPYLLFVTEVSDPLGNTATADLDYRLLAPWQTTDPNGNRSQVAFDALGRVTKAAVMGKVGSTAGDTLADPTVLYTYALDEWNDTDGAKPAYAKTEHREEHGAANTRWQTSYAFLDGAGAAAMVKVNAEPTASNGPARWVATGRTVVNNKGNPIKQYEPYFSDSWEWEWEEALAEVGVTPIVTYDALGRALRTDLPDGTFARIEPTPWKLTQWDPNDTIADPGNLWRAAREATASPAPESADTRAKDLALEHADTPSVVHFDSLGRAFLAIADNGNGVLLATKTVFDLEGQVRAVVDALGRTCASYDVSVDGQLLHELSIDAGEKWSLANVLGTPLRAWDSVGHETRIEVDALERLTHLWVKKGAGSEALRLRVLYGESYATPETNNLRGRACLVFDGAGLAESASYDFRGHALTTSRKLAATYTDEPDWTPLAASGTPSAALAQAASLLENETFTKTFVHDALGRVTSATMPDQSEIRPTYNDAGLLEAVDVRLRGAATWTAFVTAIAYDAKGRRTRIDYGNTTFTEYKYDERSSRLTRLWTTRTTSGTTRLQDLHYFYDPVGNITTIRDDVDEPVYFANQQVTATQEFVYDPIYRLISATGREHAGGIGDDQRDQNDLPLWNLPHPNDAQALRRYTETYAYDGVGNLLEMFHDAGGGSSPGTWRRRYVYGTSPFGGGAPAVPNSNRLHSTSQPGDAATGPYSATYSHDANGNMTAMPHLATLEYTHADQMRKANLGGGGTAYYTYDASGERVRKVIQRIGTTREERIYLGGWELFRKRQGASGDLVLERETLHVMDDARRIAMVETKTVDADVSGTLSIVPRLRFQYTNHLDSAHLECDETGLVISYEEYHPYGTPGYRSASAGVEVSEKRYRYTGKERDEETGFQYNSARYYAPWLVRWTSADPAGMADGGNLFVYVSGNPVRFNDPSGLDGEEPTVYSLKVVIHYPRPISVLDGAGTSGSPSRSEIVAQTSDQEFVRADGEVVPASYDPEAAAAAGEAQSRSTAVDDAALAKSILQPSRAPAGRTWLDPYGFDFARRIQDDLSRLLTYNNALWEANAPLRNCQAQQRYTQFEWNATGAGGAPPVDWRPPERPLFPGTGDHIGSFGGEFIMVATTSGRGLGVLGLGAAGARAQRTVTFGEAATPLLARGTGAFVEGSAGGRGLGIFAQRSFRVSERGLQIVESHLSQFGTFPENTAMIERLRGAFQTGAPITGADASFYFHEVSEATMMGRGMSYEVAHAASLAKYGVSPFSVYHPDVIRSLPATFNSNWASFWRF